MASLSTRAGKLYSFKIICLKCIPQFLIFNHYKSRNLASNCSNRVFLDVSPIYSYIIRSRNLYSKPSTICMECIGLYPVSCCKLFQRLIRSWTLMPHTARSPSGHTKIGFAAHVSRPLSPNITFKSNQK